MTLLDMGEQDLIERIGSMLDEGRLSRFGPMFNAEKLGGAVSLCAMQVPSGDLDQVAEEVNRLPEVAHNYARDHAWNMWFVLAGDSRRSLDQALARIESDTGLEVHDLPKLDEYYIGLRFEV